MTTEKQDDAARLGGSSVERQVRRREVLPLEAGYETLHSSGGGTMEGCTVEARVLGREPASIAGQLFDERWRPVRFARGAVGVPPVPSYCQRLDEHNLLGQSAAQALRWWLHAQAEAEWPPKFALETRIVVHTLTYSDKVEAVGVLAA